MTTESTSARCPVTTTLHRTTTALGHEGWVATGHAQVRKLYADPRLGRAHPTPETAARASDSMFFGGPMGNFDTEPADQARLRELVVPYFSPRRMRDLTPRIEELTTALFDEMAATGSPADLHTAVAVPLPLLVICELLGVPYEDRDQFRTWTEGLSEQVDTVKVQEGVAGLFAYFLTLIERKKATGGDDVLARLCARGDLGDHGIAMLGLGLLFGGHETTVVEIGLGVKRLLENPEQWQALVRDPDLVPTAIEELLRVAPMPRIPRYARDDAELDGCPVRRGDLVLLDLDSANHDPAVFPDPDRFDVTRTGAAHVTFGHGLRHCVGAPLARIELQTVFRQLVTRFPTLELAVDPSEISLRTTTFTGGVRELPVRW
ncbi:MULTISPECIES: cytochrome P450 [unclassified Nocardia]|uniref:cytochrome P450 n=1 Tax=unclassified Nocardia TaxID=2637762 RepID=UPI0033BE4122